MVLDLVAMVAVVVVTSIHDGHDYGLFHSDGGDCHVGDGDPATSCWRY